MAKIRGRGKVGDVVRIDLGNGCFGYGRVLPKTLMAFYDLQSHDPIPASEVVKSPVLFSVWAIESKEWEVIGNLPLEEPLKIEPKFFKQDFFTKEFFIYDPVKDIPATRDECVGLERAAVWDWRHTEDRLRSHFAGVPDVWSEQVKLPEA